MSVRRVGLAIGCAQSGGVTGGATVVAILNHGFSVASFVLCVIAVILSAAAIGLGSETTP